MRAVVQRVSRAAVWLPRLSETGAAAPGAPRSRQIGPGVVVLLGVGRDDSEDDALYVADKIANLRIFEDAEGKMNRSLLDVGGAALVVSQFTLYGDVRRGRRPSFIDAAAPDRALELYGQVVTELEALGVPVETGWFQEHMRVEIHNDGPVTILIDSRRAF